MVNSWPIEECLGKFMILSLLKLSDFFLFVCMFVIFFFFNVKNFTSVSTEVKGENCFRI